MDDTERCPCLSGETYGACCGRYHHAEGSAAPTAEALMRSRYTAFAVGDAAYVLATWSPSTRPTTLDLDDDVRWQRLDILRTEAGGPFDDTGVVEFVAHFRTPTDRGRLHEVSHFEKTNKRWYYVDGTTT